MNLSHMNEHEQWEAIKTWWKANGKFMIGIVIIAIALSFGYRYWQQERLQTQERSSALYDQLLQVNLSLKSPQLTQQLAAELEKNYPKTPYASLAALLEAKLAVEKNDLALAQQKLQWVLGHAKSGDLRQIARLRLARVLLAMKQPQQALTTLEVVDSAAFMPAINDAKGDILSALGKKQPAQAAYKAAAKALPAGSAARNFVEMKADN